MPVGRRYTFAIVGAALAWGSAAVAQDSASVQNVELPTAPVTVDGVTLFRVRGISSYPAERRAAEIANRIADVAGDRTIPVDSLTVQDTPTASIVVAKGQRLFGVLDVDAELEGLTRQLVAQAYRHRVAEAITEFRRDREASTHRSGIRRKLGETALALLHPRQSLHLSVLVLMGATLCLAVALLISP